ncbi:NAD+ synthase [Candidatus Omnitrophota bacterium]
MTGVRIAIAQINSIVGDLKGNTEKILLYISQAKAKEADMVVFPELALTGYPPEDLVLKPHFVKENIKYINKIAKSIKDIIAIVGFIDADNKGIYNSAGILADKKVNRVYHKICLPNYGVFDEKRYFTPGLKKDVVKAKGFSFSVDICEDIWVSETKAQKKVVSSAQFLVNISASPYHIDKAKERRAILTKKAKAFKKPIVYCNLVGGQDELVFDGRSAVFSKDGTLLAGASPFEEDLVTFDLELDIKRSVRKKAIAKPSPLKKMSKEEEVYSALVLGVRDYVRKNNFRKVNLGISGGIDSALVALVAVDALGPTNVLAVSMPSRYSSKGTQDDAEKISRNLGIRFVKIPIDDVFDSYLNTLSSHFTGMESDITEENIQARVRGNILMAFSNKFGYLVLNTGNKSEASVGYCTLYGDMAGGFAVLKDVPKDLVYKLVRYVNERENNNIVPETIIKRSPSAELSPGQKDQDTLPSYALLDKIIDLHIEKRESFKNIVKKLGNKPVVEGVLKMIKANEYKRRQAPPGIKITPLAFGRDRRMPITNKFTEAGYERHDK